jgi:hypothetical protein
MFPNTAGSSEHNATGTPLFINIGRGCIGIEDVKCYPHQHHIRIRTKTHTKISFLTSKLSARTDTTAKGLTKWGKLPPQFVVVGKSPSISDA